MAKEFVNSPNNPIEIDFYRVLCLKHGEPFRREWPRGYAVFAVEATRTILGLDRFIRETGGLVDNINKALKRRPICCRLSSDDMIRLYVMTHEATGIFGAGVCDCCGEAVLCCKINCKAEGDPVKRLRDVCFKCICRKMTVGGPSNRN